jgi:U3 small nucleolar RNA-associated protein 20
LWAPAADALSQLARRFDDLAWNLLFEEVQAVAVGMEKELRPDWMLVKADEDCEDVRDEERSWRDPSAFKMRSALRTWCAKDTVRVEIVKVSVYSVLWVSAHRRLTVTK